MNQIFFDKNQSIIIKVFPSSRLLEREICGAKSFSSLVKVPKMKRLDKRVVKISFLPGFLGYQINENDLNLLMAKFLLKVKPTKQRQNFSIFEEIDSLINVFRGEEKIIKKLGRIKQQIKGVALYPVHGDLQKQNIVIMDDSLGLIDFEHFMFAPKELELCNSLFFSDGNCLDIPGIIKLLPRKFFDQDLLRLMLRFYTFRQISLGLDQAEAEKRFKQALVKKLILPDYNFSELSARMETI